MNMPENEGFIDIMRETKLPVEEVDYVLNNPEGLTREGIEYSLKMWEKSNNRYLKKKYKEMLTKCHKIQPSGRAVDGKTILARLDGKVTWTENTE